MKTTFISTSAISQATKLSLTKLQAKLADAQKEVTTSRFADVGTSLGYQTGQTVSLRLELSRLTTITDTNAVVATRLDTTQAALQGIVDNAQSFVGQLLGARNSETGPAIIQEQAKSTLLSLTDAANTAVNGEYLFSGINADVKPLNTYDTSPPSLAQQSVASAFFAAFGVTQSDPAVANISVAQMQTFLDGAFASLFDSASWSANWSAASDQNARSRISTSELIETSTNANEQAIRKLASAYTMVADLGIPNLSEETFQAVVDQAVKIAGEALQELTVLQANLGTAQERIADANDRMSIQIDILTNHINLLESVDPAEASVRVSTLLTQIETAYAMTARIEQLSLLKYL
ncbi:MAG: flagellar hook-associated family protein [Hyphomicrobiaceae bacterium]|nr:MAG: flagellar hook-associated family protein [Hyphomicrobiaceae bacterium]